MRNQSFASVWTCAVLASAALAMTALSGSDTARAEPTPQAGQTGGQTTGQQTTEQRGAGQAPVVTAPSADKVKVEPATPTATGAPTAAAAPAATVAPSAPSAPALSTPTAAPAGAPTAVPATLPTAAPTTVPAAQPTTTATPAPPAASPASPATPATTTATPSPVTPPAAPSAAAAPGAAPATAPSAQSAATGNTATPEAAKPEAAKPATVAIPAAAAPPAQSSDAWRAAFAKAFDTPEVTKGWSEPLAEALRGYYMTATAPLWHDGLKENARQATLVKVLKNADAWGLAAKDYEFHAAALPATNDTVAIADVALTARALEYANAAEGGRIVPSSISQLIDVKPPLTPPAEVLKALVAASAPDQTLEGYHPQHAGFKALHAALDKIRNPAGKAVEEEVDEALLVRLPPGKVLRKGSDDPDVALLRKRLKVEAEDGASANAFDEALEIAVMAFQEGQGVRSDGIVGSRTRAALNGELVRDERNADRDAERIIVNMERWRWLPKDLGPLYVMNNIPEFVGRVIKDGAPIFEERIIVGLPNWPTPTMSDKIEHIVFNPSWGVPDGIKTKELQPRLQRASGGNDFFSQLFGGGSSSGGARVLAAYGLKPYLNGREIDANSVNWNNVDIRRYTFIQPPGEKNPLGKVKFMFPNTHDVYMHDTTQRSLFGQSRRALSHGCIRVQNPERLAEVLLGEDQGMSAGNVAGQFRGGGTVHLKSAIPVHLVYITATVSADGKLKTFGDIYGLDGRVYSALTGERMRYQTPVAVASDIETSSTPRPARQKKQSGASYKRPSGNTAGDMISNALSGILNN